MNELRRFEILLPRRFNDGSWIPKRLFVLTLRELRIPFGAVSNETQVIRGQWEYSGVIFRDEVMRGFVDAPRTSHAQDFFVEFKETLKARFQQIEMWITWFDIGTI